MAIKSIKIGTRGSKLALVQAEMLKAVIIQHFPDMAVELCIIKTKGDKILDTPLSQIGDKGLFVKELEEALLRREVDLCVHSLKDLPGILPDGLTLAAVLPRAEVRDVLITRDGRKLRDLTRHDRIGSSSLRRKAQILAFNPELNLSDVRGNVDTRLKKLEEGQYTALLLAAAGMLRLGYGDKITEYLDPGVIIPAASQGIIGIEIRSEDPLTSPVMARINHSATFQTALAERIFLATLEGGCQIPLGCYTEILGDTGRMTGFIAAIDGSQVIRRSLTRPVAKLADLARDLANNLLEAGGRQILDEIRRSAPCSGGK
jgi:hydroxymethylbilane synthase